MNELKNFFAKTIKAVSMVYSVKFASKMNSFKTIPMRIMKKAKKLLQSAISFLFAKPTSLKEYFKIEDWYISKKFVFKSFLVLLLIWFLSSYYLYPWLEGKLWYAHIVVNTEKFHTFTGKSLVYDQNENLIYQGYLQKGIPNGVADVYKNNKLVYHGNLNFNVREGYGTEYSGGYLIYEGDFSNNLYDGNGVRYFGNENNDRYMVGEFFEGNLTEGTVYLENGDKKYVGTFENGDMHGVGTLYENDAPLYSGNFSYDKKDGMGNLYDDGNLIYKGEFFEDSYNGIGELYDDNKLIYKGGFLADNFHGEGILYEKDSLLYEGTFINNVKQGEGVLYNPEIGKKIYDGSFQNDSFEGFGTEFDQVSGRVLYTGDFSNGLYEGVGTLYSNSGQKLFEGSFFKGSIDYIQFLNSDEFDIQEAFGKEDSLEMFEYSYFTVYQQNDIIFEYHFSSDGEAPKLSNMKFLGDQQVYGVSNDKTIEDMHELFGEDIPYSTYSFLIDDNERYVLRMIDDAKTIGTTLHAVKYNFEDYYIRCYSLEVDGEILYFEVGGN